MEQDKIRQIFSRHFNGQKNLLTGDIVRYGKAGRFFYELSTGEAFLGVEMFGVTVLSGRGWQKDHEHDLSGCFHSLDKAEAHIKTELGG